jgi:hypothetical protein
MITDKKDFISFEIKSSKIETFLKPNKINFQ